MVYRPRAVAHREAKTGRQAKTKPQDSMLDFKLEDVITAVKSLYADEVKPFGRVVLKRLREQAADRVAVIRGMCPGDVDPDEMPRVDPRRLRKICEACSHLNVRMEEGREYSVLLKHEPDSFVDVRSTEDPYKDKFWLATAAYFNCLGDDLMRMPGGRYACAVVLCRRDLPFLKGLSLGKVCHVVQLAISKRKILGYLDGFLVPFHASEERKKEECALFHTPFAQDGDVDKDVLPIASWRDVRNGLRQLFRSNIGQGRGAVALSNIKRLFRTKLHMELSETALGHARLHDLLTDSRLRGECTLNAGSGGQIFVSAPARYTTPCHHEEIKLPKRTPVLPISMGCDDVATSANLCDIKDNDPHKTLADAATWEVLGFDKMKFCLQGASSSCFRPRADSGNEGYDCDQSTTDGGRESRTASGDVLDSGANFSGQWTPPPDVGRLAEQKQWSSTAPMQLAVPFPDMASNEWASTRYQVVKNTFIHFEEPNDHDTSSRRYRRRSSSSVPPSFGKEEDA